MKKLALGVMLALLVVIQFLPPAAAGQPINVYVGRKLLDFDVPPVVRDGRVLVPVRAIFEALGANVEWDEKTKTVHAEMGEQFNVSATVNETLADINGYTEELDVPPQIVKGRVMVPLRFAAESFGAFVEWNSATATVKIFYKPSLGIEAADIVELATIDKDLDISALRPLPNDKFLIEAQSEVDGNIDIHYYVFELGTKALKKLITVPGSDSSSFVSKQGDILYYIHNVQTDLYKLDLNGKTTRFTNTPYITESWPVWSPDGKKIAYFSVSTDTEKHAYISVINSDGSGQVDFDFPVHDDVALTWSPDGKQLAYSLYRMGDSNGIWTVNSDGTARKRILKMDGLDYPNWSPDGTWLSATNGNEFIVVKNDGTGVKRMKGLTPVWSPDGKLLLYNRFDEIWIWHPVLDKVSPISYGNTGSLSWSNNQKAIFNGAGYRIEKITLNS